MKGYFFGKGPGEEMPATIIAAFYAVCNNTMVGAAGSRETIDGIAARASAEVPYPVFVTDGDKNLGKWENGVEVAL